MNYKKKLYFYMISKKPWVCIIDKTSILAFMNVYIAHFSNFYKLRRALENFVNSCNSNGLFPKVMPSRFKN
jgi:hypothetical protein